MFQQLFTTLVWIAANGLYIDLRRKGRGGLARILFFWMGIPATFLWLFLVPEGKQQERLEPPEDDYQRILQEIRSDRALPGAEEGSAPGDAEDRTGRRENRPRPPAPGSRDRGGSGDRG